MFYGYYAHRAFYFLVELFRNMVEHPDWTMPQVYSESYSKTIHRGFECRHGEVFLELYSYFRGILEEKPSDLGI